MNHFTVTAMTIFRSQRAIFAQPIFYFTTVTGALQHLVEGLVRLLVWWLSFPVLIRHVLVDNKLKQLYFR